MALSEKDKRILKEKYKQSRRESWGIRIRKKVREEVPSQHPSVPEETTSESPPISVLRRSEENPENTTPQETIIDAPASEVPAPTTVPIAAVPQELPDQEETSGAVWSSSPHRPDPSAEEHQQIRRQLQEKIKEQRRASWAGERTAPGLTTPPKRKSEKAEREFWSEPRPKKKGVSLGIALLVVLGCVGIVVIGVLLGLLLTRF